MKTNTAGSKGVSLILMIAGAVMTIAALALDFMGSISWETRSPSGDRFS